MAYRVVQQSIDGVLQHAAETDEAVVPVLMHCYRFVGAAPFPVNRCLSSLHGSVALQGVKIAEEPARRKRS